MEKELRQRTQVGAVSLLAVLIGGFACFGAFSRKPARQIWNRAQGKSELSGKCAQAGYNLERAHLCHSRSELYQNPGMGLLVTAGEHFILHEQLYGRTGLTPPAEEFALEHIQERITPKEEREMTMAGILDGNYQPPLILWKERIPAGCKDCLARIAFPTSFRYGLVEMSSVCLAKKMMDIGTPPEGLKDFIDQVVKTPCPVEPQTTAYINQK